MPAYTKEDLEEALAAIAEAIARSEKAQEKFAPGVSQHTLLKNRIKALTIAYSLLERGLGKGDCVFDYTQADLKNALAPLASLISKSEKAQKKVLPGTWQHTMLGKMLKALYLASPLVTKEWEAMRASQTQEE